MFVVNDVLAVIFSFFYFLNFVVGNKKEVKRMSIIQLDENGNINTNILEKELQLALESDVRYKQTDGMKKRAIKVAQSYDEFKNMVACAHQKPVT